MAAHHFFNYKKGAC